MKLENNFIYMYQIYRKKKSLGWIKHLEILLTSSKNAMQEIYPF